jgi:LAGLIDADG DNA endonuclease family
MKISFARYFSTTSVNLKSITVNKATGLKKILRSDEAKLAITCPPFLIPVLVGCLLGDLTARKRKYTFFKFEQSSIHGLLLYLIYLFSLFYDFCGSFPNIEKRRDTRNNKTYYSIYFCTLSFPCFDELYELFYLNGIKRIPPNISELLTPVSLA